jgi:hypothetical protein
LIDDSDDEIYDPADQPMGFSLDFNDDPSLQMEPHVFSPPSVVLPLDNSNFQSCMEYSSTYGIPCSVPHMESDDIMIANILGCSISELPERLSQMPLKISQVPDVFVSEKLSLVRRPSFTFFVNTSKFECRRKWKIYSSALPPVVIFISWIFLTCSLWFRSHLRIMDGLLKSTFSCSVNRFSDLFSFWPG